MEFHEVFRSNDNLQQELQFHGLFLLLAIVLVFSGWQWDDNEICSEIREYFYQREVALFVQFIVLI